MPLAIIDLDGAIGDVRVCLDELHAERRIKTLAGMSVFAASPGNLEFSESIQPLHLVEKTELLLQLRRLLQSDLA